MKVNRKLHAVINLLLGDVERQLTEMVEEVNSSSIANFERLNSIINYLKGQEKILKQLDQMNLNGDFEE